ncbi:MAG: cobalt ECF transporter T component CbiQ [Chloroflexota bacterium]|nr:cobalt ECF transporter T component CbiQ [Chloroflexota bacterium]
MNARRGFIERSIADITATLEKAIFSEEMARRDGFLQKLDPRVKVITFLALLLAVSLSQGLLIIVVLYFLTLLLAWRSRIPLGFFIKRVWLFMPFFTGLVALPALFNIFTPGEPIINLWQSERFHLAITMQGLRTATFLVLRVGASVSLAVLSVLTTPWATLLKALRILRLPSAFILILGMAYRYAFLLLHTANNMFLARRSRTVGQMSGGENRRWIATSASTLLAKSYHLSQEVYLAMLSRGFQGEAKMLGTFRLKPSDWLWGATLLALALLAILMGT